jgi:glycosyltransferase involved in cell wall biosynthesis
MRINHISFSSSGGAGVVARELCRSQRELGLNCQELFLTDGDVRLVWNRHPQILATALVDFYLVRKHLKAPLFSLLRNGGSLRLGALSSNDGVINHLHWIPGVIDHKTLMDLKRLDAPVVWTLHDMWPFTGGCHHSRSCENFMTDCRNCPQVRVIAQKNVAKSLKRKVEILNDWSRLRVVAPSNWIAERARRSAVFNEVPVDVIANPVHDVFFAQTAVKAQRIDFGIPNDAFVFGLAAANPSDPVKGIARALGLLDSVQERAHGHNIMVMLIGGGPIPAGTRRVPVVQTGFVKSREQMASMFGLMDAFVSLSEVDTAPLVVAEALASGIPLICSAVGGLPEYVDSGRNGFSITDDETFLQAATFLIENDAQRQEMTQNARRFAEQQFQSSNVAAAYVSLYQKLLAGD